jgi:ABC-2 type transport system ATP-binding protein
VHPGAAFAIEADGLTKIFRSFWRRREVRAVDGVSLAVPRGAVFGLLGPNGAGKTTFVKMLLSAVRPTAGRARVFGASRRRRARGAPSGTCRRITASRPISPGGECWNSTARFRAWTGAR